MRGLHRYYDGTACPKGHKGFRYTYSDICIACTNHRKEVIKQKARRNEKMRVAKLVPISFYTKRDNLAAVSDLEELDSISKGEAKERTAMLKRASKKRYNKKYPEKRKAHRRARKLNMRQAMPSWETHANIALTYSLAAIAGDDVDHIVPLNSPLVCGLHCTDNLQCLTPLENMRKGNRIWPDMP